MQARRAAPRVWMYLEGHGHSLSCAFCVLTKERRNCEKFGNGACEHEVPGDPRNISKATILAWRKFSNCRLFGKGQLFGKTNSEAPLSRAERAHDTRPGRSYRQGQVSSRKLTSGSILLLRA